MLFLFYGNVLLYRFGENGWLRLKSDTRRHFSHIKKVVVVVGVNTSLYTDTVRQYVTKCTGHRLISIQMPVYMS